MLQRAHAAGPHFADPSELMGEALMRKGDFRGAIIQFRLADDAAPRWGKNHLRWGQSLLRIGQEREARAQLEAARGLSLSASDRSELDVPLQQTKPRARD